MNNIKSISNKLQRDGLESLYEIRDWISTNLEDYGGPKKRAKIKEIVGKEVTDLLRKRGAADIINDGFTTGCGDVAIVFATLARSKGMPVQFIEAVQEDCLRELSLGSRHQSMKGHVFLRVKIGGKWVLLDPMQKSADGKRPNIDFSDKWCNEFKPGGIINEPESKQGRYIIYGIGLDSHDIGLRSFEDMREKFLAFSRRIYP
ncbi:MAG: transglutaminase domain-containing protein [Candidatus Altiarchaeota archaeon]